MVHGKMSTWRTCTAPPLTLPLYLEKNMKLIKQICISVFLLSLLNGCTLNLSCVLFNNTSGTLFIYQNNHSSTVPPGETVKLKYWAGHILKIKSEKNTWSYHPDRVSIKIARIEGWWLFVEQVLYAQIEPDGTIYALTNQTNAPVNIFPDQPKEFGFPLKPE